MKHPIRFPSGKERILLIAASVCLFTAGILAFLSAVIRGGQPSQQMAQRWDQEGGSAQISCFFSNGLEITPKRPPKMQDFGLPPTAPEARSRCPAACPVWILLLMAWAEITFRFIL